MFLAALQRILKSHVFKKDNSIKFMTFIALPRSLLILTVLLYLFLLAEGTVRNTVTAGAVGWPRLGLH